MNYSVSDIFGVPGCDVMTELRSASSIFTAAAAAFAAAGKLIVVCLVCLSSLHSSFRLPISAYLPEMCCIEKLRMPKKPRYRYTAMFRDTVSRCCFLWNDRDELLLHGLFTSLSVSVVQHVLLYTFKRETYWCHLSVICRCQYIISRFMPTPLIDWRTASSINGWVEIKIII